MTISPGYCTIFVKGMLAALSLLGEISSSCNGRYQDQSDLSQSSRHNLWQRYFVPSVREVGDAQQEAPKCSHSVHIDTPSALQAMRLPEPNLFCSSKLNSA